MSAWKTILAGLIAAGSYAVVVSQLRTLIALAKASQKEEVQEMANLADVKAAVDALDTAVGQLVTLCDTNFAALNAAIATGADPTALQAIVDSASAELQSVKDTLARDTQPAPAPPAA